MEIIFESRYATHICFLGGTCLRIVHVNNRFSEDLDFDNMDLNENDFQAIANEIEKQLEREGYEVELKTVLKGAWHCHIKFPGLLFDEGLSGHSEEKILIQLDTEPQHFDYDPDRHILNKFDVFTTILTTPLPLLMAQKIYAIINRKRNKGRDFFDLVFLMSRDIKPDYSYLDAKLSITNADALKEKILVKCNQLNMEDMANDVRPFIFDTSDTKKIVRFVDLVKQYSF
ncbi:MAG: nucleotidyl transferase AbiEii/AbiGii toxin family protein [Balneolaceae bacterium]|nr:nucleotidyl transferase AbiEii/AbiGii toxin family protein [Balneolaceae bacterium]